MTRGQSTSLKQRHSCGRHPHRFMMLGLFLTCLLSATWSAAHTETAISVNSSASPSEHRAVQQFISEMQRKHGFDKTALSELFGHAAFRGDIIEAITRPAEAKPWHTYRPIFLTEPRPREGAAFMKQYAETLNKAENAYGVPPAIITAIIGVESRYGRHSGRYRISDALVTLACNYPRRAEFFRGELEQFLLLTREENVDPLSLKGSYAGAMGQPQFMPSSFRNYAVDFDGDGKRDLWENAADVIGSVANYLSVHGWQRGKPVVTPAAITGTGYQDLLKQGIKPHTTIKDLANKGVNIDEEINRNLKGALFKLDGHDGPEYWVGLQNFHTVTRYNRSTLYAMAVIQLSQKIVESN